MLALAGSRLSQQGWAVLLPDLGGTGDSAGEFLDARVDAWLDDIVATAALAAETAPVTAILAVRLGACLVPGLLDRGLRPEQLIFWQPVLAGQQHLTQFLRLGVAAAALGGGAGVTVGSLRARLGAGESLEIAGYELGPPLAADIDALRMQVPVIRPLPSLHCLEVSNLTDAAVSPPVARLVQDWMGQGGNARAATCPGQPFWATVETGLSEALLVLTADALRGNHVA